MFIVVSTLAAQKRALAAIQPQIAPIPLPAVSVSGPILIRRPKSIPLVPVQQPPKLEIAVPEPEEIPEIIEPTSTAGFEVKQLPSNLKRAALPVAQPPLSIPEPEELIEEKPRPRVLLNREGQLKRFIDKLKKSGSHWLWTATKWNGTEPTYSVDGKSMPVTEAAYLLYTGLPFIADGMKPYAKCHKYNCLAKDCLILVPCASRRNAKKVDAFGIEEILRLKGLGKSDEEIARLIEKHSPSAVRKVVSRSV